MLRGALAFLLALVALACQREPQPQSAAAGTPHRIVALTCGAVDVLTQLGELDRVIAVEEDCPAPGTESKLRLRNDDHPGQVQVVQIESILALAPDLVIAKEDLREVFADRGLRVLWAPNLLDLETLPGFVNAVAAAVGVPERGEQLVAHMREVEDELRARTAGLPRVRVYYEINGLGRSVGRGSIVDALLRLAGGENIAGDDPRPRVDLTPEFLLAADPEVIVLGPFAQPDAELLARPGWKQLSAVQHGRVHRIDESLRYVTLATPRCVDGCRDLFLPWLHPELAAPPAGGAK